MAPVLVEAIQMRREGVKLTPEELAAGYWRKGHIELFAQGECNFKAYDGIGGPTVFPSLREARVRTWRGDCMVIVGLEFDPGSGVPGRFRPQAWLVRFLTPAARAGLDP